jgi:hypothetical protein
LHSSRLANYVLAWFDEPVVMWRLWKTNWFPYRTYKLIGFDEKTGDMNLGEPEWNRPRRFDKRKPHVED